MPCATEVVVHDGAAGLAEVAQLIYEVARHPIRYGTALAGADEVAREGEYLAGCAADADQHRR